MAQTPTPPFSEEELNDKPWYLVDLMNYESPNTDITNSLNNYCKQVIHSLRMKQDFLLFYSCDSLFLRAAEDYSRYSRE